MSVAQSASRNQTDELRAGDLRARLAGEALDGREHDARTVRVEVQEVHADLHAPLPDEVEPLGLHRPQPSGRLADLARNPLGEL